MFRRLVRRRQDCLVGSFCLLLAVTSLWLYMNTSVDLPVLHDTLISYPDEFSSDRASVNTYVAEMPDNFKDNKGTTQVATHSDLTLPRFIIGNASTCAESVGILVYVQSNWENFLRRRHIRRTWASVFTHKNTKLKYIFILGRPKDTNDQIKINNEQLLHGDILEGDFVDSFQNLTIKSQIIMKWIQTHCKHASYVLKADDDIFVNIFDVIEMVLPSIEHENNVILCHLVKDGKSPIVRDKKSKWFIPSHIFPNRTHLPQFCSGFMVIMTSQAIRNLYTQSLITSAVNVDDVYMFGQLAQGIPDIQFVDLSKNVTLSHDKGVSAYKNGERHILAVNVRDSQGMEELWSLALMNSAHWTKSHFKVV